jgi:hypothetical protein
VNADGVTSPLDALTVINFINTSGAQIDPTPSDGQHAFLDVNKDGLISALDALVVINQLDGVDKAIAMAQASSLPTVSSGSANVGSTTNAAAALAVSATLTPAPGGVVAPSTSAPQLADLAFAVYNGEDLAMAANALSGSAVQNGTVRRPGR